MPFQSLSDLESHEVIPGYHAVFIHMDHMTLAYWKIEAGAEMPEHSHPHEQVANLLEGEFEMTLEGEQMTLEPGTVAVIPSGTPHGGRAIKDCRILDVFHPVREDYIFD